jgi:hypothetical protein
MTYAVWIALAVVALAIVPPIVKNARAKKAKDSESARDSAPSGDAGGEGSS